MRSESLEAALMRAQLDLAGVRARGRTTIRLLRRGVGRVRRVLRGGPPAASPVAPGPHGHVPPRRPGVPIVFIHRGNHDYLAHSLRRAATANPDSSIYLLGDESNTGHAGIHHRRFSDYSAGAARFARIYRHFNTNSYAYELFNFQRWYMLRDFLAAEQLDACLYLDSDVLLFADVTREQRKFAHYDLAIAGISGAVFYLNRRAALEALLGFIDDTFSRRDRYSYDRMVAHYVARRRSRLPGGVCDMTALDYFREAHAGQVGEVTQIIDGAVYDLNINEPQGFVMHEGRKRIEWQDGQPYGTLARSGARIRFCSLHFQGASAKRVMAAYAAHATRQTSDRQT